MSTTKEFRFAVGLPSASRSCVWKLWVYRSDVYIQPRMMGSDAKVSLHESGAGNYSLTSEWVRAKAPRGFERARRHMRKWQIPKTEGGKAAHVFRIIIPASELRPVEAEEDLSAVTWLPTPTAGEALIVECYLTPPVEGILDTAAFPYDHLTSLSRCDRRRFVALWHTEAVSQHNGSLLERGRCQVKSAAQKVGLSPDQAYRATLFLEGEGRVKGLIEMVPF